MSHNDFSAWILYNSVYKLQFFLTLSINSIIHHVNNGHCFRSTGTDVLIMVGCLRETNVFFCTKGCKGVSIWRKWKYGVFAINFCDFTPVFYGLFKCHSQSWIGMQISSWQKAKWEAVWERPIRALFLDYRLKKLTQRLRCLKGGISCCAVL